MNDPTNHLDDAELAARIATACRARAESVQVDDAPFDPDLSGSMLELDLAGSQTRRTRRPVLVAAALVAVLGAGAVVATTFDYGGSPAPQTVAGEGDASTGPETGSPTVTEPAPVGDSAVPEVNVLALPADPDGTTLQEVTWSEQTPGETRLAQLFGSSTDDSHRILVLVGPANQGSIGGDGDTVAVRGYAAVSAPSKVQPDRSTTLVWEDDGASVEARFTGYDRAAAIAMLDGLQWRSADHAEGFAAPGGSPIELVGSASSGGSSSSARYEYADVPASVSPGDGLQLTLTTTKAEGTTMAYLETAFLGDRDAEGRVRSFDASWGTLALAWPDGRAAVIDANKTPFTEVELQTMLDGLVPIDGDGLLALRDRVRAAESASPVRASTLVASGTVELRGDSQRPVLCLVVAGARTCGSDPEGRGLANLSIDGTWYVVAVTDHPATVFVTGQEPVVAGQPEELVAEHGSLGDQYATVIAPRSDLDAVNVRSEAGQNLTAVRPSA